MVIGPAFLLLALLAAAGAAYLLLLDRSRALALLDRRIAARAEVIAGPPPIRRRTPLAVPDFIAPFLARAQIEPTTKGLIVLIALFVSAFAMALLLAGAGMALAVIVSLVAGTVFFIRARARRRIEALTDALPFYIDGVRQLMAVGSSLSQALLRALPTAQPIVQSFFGPAARRIELGAPIGESMQQLADRLQVAEVSMISAAIRVNLRFGGAMTAILSNLASIVRERLRIKRELASATAEVRVSTLLLIGLPLLVVGFLLAANESYRNFFVHDPRGHRLAMIAGVLQLIGITIMNRLKRLSF